MRNITSIQIKAALLLFVFGLNTIVGFACSVGVDMGFNSGHHHDEATVAVVHIHKDGKKHVHHDKKNTSAHTKSHHDALSNRHENPQQGKDDCCNDKVLKFEQLDKSVPHSFNAIHPTFLITFFDVFYDIALPSPGIVKNIRQFARSYHPPIPDIRIAIQSFQI